MQRYACLRVDVRAWGAIYGVSPSFFFERETVAGEGKGGEGEGEEGWKEWGGWFG